MSEIPPMFDLSGKVAVITGSTKGIGKSIAEQMAAVGAKVVVSSRKADACERVAADINANWAKFGGAAIPQACNISHKDQCHALIDRAIGEWGQVDILVCNAAVNPFLGSMRDIPEEAFDKTMNANVKSNLWLVNAVVPGMIERRDGVIIIIGSTGGLRGTATLGAYGMSKAADMQLVRNITVEWGQHNIRANCIAPSLVKTDMAKALWSDPKRIAAIEDTYPLRRIGDPEDVSGLCVMLASRAGAWIAGQTIPVDGGMLAAGGR